MKFTNLSQKTKSVLLACGIAIYGSLACQPVFANPEGGVVVAGSATIQGQGTGNTQITQTSDKAAINWQSFSIGQGETTRFVQPSSQSIALNRVVGSNPSSIFGHLQSNGQVWLVNPAGVIFGPTSRVDVGGLLATTANIKTADFMQGNYRFVQTPGNNSAVVAQGTINAKDSGVVALVAPGVENSGVIQARMGKVALASGTEFTVDLYGDQLINFAASASTPTQRAVTADGRVLPNAVSNSGTIMADGGTVLMTAKAARQVVNNVINMSGVVQARGAVQGNGGEIVLLGGDQGTVSVSGKLDVSSRGTGGKGGKVVVTGETVKLASATIDASGDTGGGQVFVGGGAHGQTPSIINAQTVSVDQNSVITADALANGNGGQVVFWSNQNTNFAGYASAIAGSEGGNGGFIEVSGRNLDVAGTVDAHASHGAAGNVLFDPATIVIGTTQAATISTTLNGGTSVTVSATDSITDNADITSFNATASLTFVSNLIDINANIEVPGGVNVTGVTGNSTNSGAVATLIAPLSTSTNTWNVTGANSGNLVMFSNGSANTTINFSNIGNLSGNDGSNHDQADTFKFIGSASLSGSMTGGGATNTLDLSGMTNLSALSIVLNTATSGSILQGSTSLGRFQNIQTFLPSSVVTAVGTINGVNTANATLQQSSNGNPFGDPNATPSQQLAYFIASVQAGALTEQQIAQDSLILSGLTGRTIGICP